MKYKDLILFIFLMIFTTLFLPLQYKLYWLLLCSSILYKLNKKYIFLGIIISILITPSLMFQNISFYEYKKINNFEFKINKYLKEEKDDFLIARYMCYFEYDNCEYSFINKNKPAYYNAINGNIYHISYDKRSIYRFNKYLSNLDIRNKTIFLPQSKEDLVIYNYSIFKDLVFEDIMKNENKCKLLIYGAQNGWNSYKEELIKQLEKDNNECISNLLDIETPHDEKLINKEESKKDLLLFLKKS